MRVTSGKWLLPIFLVAACGGEVTQVPEDDNSALDQAIVNGKADTGHPTVGKIRFDGDEICTGTLVGTKTVTTAAHCILGSASRYAFVLNGKVYAASIAKAHPSWKQTADQGEGTNDIAVLVLKTAPGIAPTPVAVTAPVVGQAITLVGYGVTLDVAEDFGLKRIANNTISEVTATKLYFEPGSRVGTTCYGDSGGPAFTIVNGQEVEAGITSGGEVPCEEGYAWDTRVDKYVDWIASVTSNDVVRASTTPVAVPDTKSPTVRITSPASRATVAKNVTVKATITDDVGCVKASLEVDGTIVSTLTQAPWAFPATLRAGSRQLRVYGWDASGKRGQYTVTVTAR